MGDPAGATATQLRNIEVASGMTLADFALRVDEQGGLERHGQVLAFLKAELGLSHGNANLIAHLILQERAGGPPPAETLLGAQYAGGKAHLRPVLERVTELAEDMGADVEKVVLKTGVSFRRRRQFALVEARSSTRVQLGLNLPSDPDDPRVVAISGMCSHKVDLGGLDDVDESIAGLLRAAYEAAA